MSTLSVRDVAESPTLSVARGPLADGELDAIAATYGTVDPRYADREFCRLVFNENPHGRSYHAFVRDGDRVIGHYAVIPIRGRSRGVSVATGKGEALFLAEHGRRSIVATSRGDVPTGIALMQAAHDAATADGIAVLHNITSPEIGVIERLLGFRALTIRLDQFHAFTALQRRSFRRISLRFIVGGATSFAQRVLLGAVRLALRVTGPRVDVRAATAERHLSALALDDPSAGATWSVSRDHETLRWFARIGRFEVVSVARRPDRFAISTTGNSRELLVWCVPPDAVRDGVALLAALVARAVEARAQTFSITRRLVDAGGPSLGVARRMLGLVPQHLSAVLYAKSSDPFYVQPNNVAFSRLFHL